MGAAGNSHADRHCLRAGSTHSALLLLLGPITCCSVYMGCTHVGALAERGTVVCDPNVMVQTHLGVGIVIPHHQHREGRCNFFLHRPRGTYAEENAFAICPAMRCVGLSLAPSLILTSDFECNVPQDCSCANLTPQNRGDFSDTDQPKVTPVIAAQANWLS